MLPSMLSTRSGMKWELHPPPQARRNEHAGHQKVVLENFKSFDAPTLQFDLGTNVLIGDNETDKAVCCWPCI